MHWESFIEEELSDVPGLGVCRLGLPVSDRCFLELLLTLTGLSEWEGEGSEAELGGLLMSSDSV